MGCFKRTASKHVYYLGWNRSPAQVGCMRQALGPGALGRPRGIGWRGRLEGGLGWGTHINPWLIHFNVWQNPLQLKKKEKNHSFSDNWPRYLNLGAGSSSPILFCISLVFSKSQFRTWFPSVMPSPTPGFNLFLRLLVQGATVTVPFWRFSQPAVVRGIHSLTTSMLDVLIQTGLYLLC